MAPVGTEKFGRPQLQTILDRQNQSNANKYITLQLLRASALLQLMTWDSSAVANGRQKTLTYNYTRREVARVGQLRDFNTDYAPAYSGGESPQTAVLRPIGDAFEIDRVFGDADPDYVDEQVSAMAPAVTSRLADMIINGDNTANAREITGLSKMLTGTAQVKTGLNLTLDGTTTQIGLRRNVARISAEVRRLVALGLKPVILGNADVIAALELGGDVLGFSARTQDAFGSFSLPTIAGAPLLDVGMTTIFGTPAAATPTIYPVESAEIIPTVGGTTTDLYIVGMSSINGLTGVTLDGSNGTSPVNYRTNATDAGVVRRYEVEVVAGVALLDERAAVKFDDVVIA